MEANFEFSTKEYETDILSFDGTDEEDMYYAPTFRCTDAQDMYNFSKLLEYSESNTIKNLAGKKVRVVLKGTLLVALGHETQDKFLTLSSNKRFYFEDTFEKTLKNVLAIWS